MPKVRKLSAEEIEQLAARYEEREAQETAQSISPESTVLENAYPHIAAWVDGGGWIEIGQTDYSRSYIRILDLGGMLWEGPGRYSSLDYLLRAAEEALIRLEESGEI
jgi:hypothetical protein